MCSKTGAILYKAQSQDEEALVHAAAQLHMDFVNRNENILGKSFAFGCYEKDETLVEMMMLFLLLGTLQRSGLILL